MSDPNAMPPDGWEQRVLDATAIEIRAAEAVRAARAALSSGLDIDQPINVEHPQVATAIATLAGAILLAWSRS